ncbi:hypothetical protein PF006_g16129 [Phytophthora fragariae]|uniref:Uncharacterized protein n=1 Tax=Phytophthora fragariae TaxID=53985 RepID=A0A6A3T3R2_9STRA|nr:hypothetical protein PF006_g16129 [Phytophthora fragariae]
MHGQHSTQRVLELTKYANETSWLRVITILLVTPLPCLVVTVLVDILPLADPSEGLEGNKMYFVRLFYTFMVITFLATHQFRLNVPVLPYPLQRTIRNTVFISGFCVGVYYGLASDRIPAAVFVDDVDANMDIICCDFFGHGVEEEAQRDAWSWQNARQLDQTVDVRSVAGFHVSSILLHLFDAVEEG